MYSWKTIRIVSFILLVLPIVHVTYLISRDTMETLDTTPDAWAREVNAYAAADAQRALPQHPVVVVGGMRAKLWPGLGDILAPRPVLMRGLGNAIVEDIIYHYPSLIGFYQPDSVVLVPGNSEFFIRDNKSGPQLAKAIQDLAKLDASYGVTRRFYIVTPVKTPVRPQDYPAIDEAVDLLTSWAEADERVVILDANRLLSDPEGQPKAYYFRGDGVNLNEHGYLRLSVMLLAQMDKDTAAAPPENTPPP